MSLINRGYLQGGQDPVHDSFGLPRQWFMFSGHVTKELGYFVSIQNGFDTVSGLDMFLDLNYDRRLQFRKGRFKTPFTYEFFIEPIQGLITPERSMFFNNFGQNRDVGVMAYGQLFNGPNFDQVSKFQYAAGIFNGNRNGFLANQDGNSSPRSSTFIPSATGPIPCSRTLTLVARSSQATMPRQPSPIPCALWWRLRAIRSTASPS
ncbi:MAG: hypothetical protein ACLQGP_33110 [Isosphaeraceae bacterium]